MELYTKPHSTVTRNVKPDNGNVVFVSTLPVSEDFIGQYECIGFQVTENTFLDKLVVFKEKKIKTSKLKTKLINLASRITYLPSFLELARTQENVIIFNPYIASTLSTEVGGQGSGVYLNIDSFGNLLHTYIYTKPSNNAILPTFSFGIREVTAKPKGVPVPLWFRDVFIVQSNGRSTWCIVPDYDGISESRLQTAHLSKVQPQLFTAHLVKGLFADIPSQFKIAQQILGELIPTEREIFFIGEKEITYKPALERRMVCAEDIFRIACGDYIKRLENEVRKRGLCTTIIREIQMLKRNSGRYVLYNHTRKQPIKSSSEAFKYLTDQGFFNWR